MSTLIKRRAKIKDSEATDKEFEYLIDQLLHKEDVQPKIRIINMSVEKKHLGEFADPEIAINVLNSGPQIVVRNGNKLYKVDLTEITS